MSGQRAEHDRRTERVAAMTGIDRSATPTWYDRGRRGPEFPPVLDLVAPRHRGRRARRRRASPRRPRRRCRHRAHGRRRRVPRRRHRRHAPRPLVPRAARAARGPLLELVRWVAWMWPAEVVAAAAAGRHGARAQRTIDDGWNGTLGWFWVACAVTTIVLVVRDARRAARSGPYSAVMAATGPALPGDPHRLRHRSRGQRRLAG